MLARFAIGKRTWDVEVPIQLLFGPDIPRGGTRMTTMIADPPRKTTMGVALRQTRPFGDSQGMEEEHRTNR